MSNGVKFHTCFSIVHHPGWLQRLLFNLLPNREIMASRCWSSAHFVIGRRCHFMSFWHETTWNPSAQLQKISIHWDNECIKFYLRFDKINKSQINILVSWIYHDSYKIMVESWNPRISASASPFITTELGHQPSERAAEHSRRSPSPFEQRRNWQDSHACNDIEWIISMDKCGLIIYHKWL